MISQLRQEQTGEGVIPFDPNCGRYCADAAIRFVSRQDNPLREIPRDAFNSLPVPTKGNFFLIFRGRKWAWDPDKEGSELTRSLWTENPLAWGIADWRSKLDRHGPLIISGPIALHGWISHYVLAIGVDEAREELIYKDPIGASETRKSLDWIRKHINAVHRLTSLDNLRAHAPDYFR
ncbi:papain-like cysteine protease family protein [Silvibacterium sp.]|uniref:papain-like cysteine protease family protein n=1 Tax=Silvibacterium sp. TaxID=1964179 RepID=UPI0039E41B88